jgi:hypothetical protein
MLSIVLIVTVVSAEPFDRYDYTMLGGLVAVSVFDVMNTRYHLDKVVCDSTPAGISSWTGLPAYHCGTWDEANPVLGKRPDAFSYRVGVRDLLQPLDADLGDDQRQARGPAWQM